MQNLNELAFQKACLIQLTTSVWTASKSIESGLLEQIGQNSEWVKGRKYLINPEILGQVKTAAHQARNKVKKYALPFPIMSIQLIPKEYVSTVEEILQHYKQQFWDRVCVFEEMYADAREEAKQELGNLFNEADYPANIKSKFKFDWLFLAIQLPDKTSILSPEIYEREKNEV